MFSKTAELYDAIYSWKNYGAETDALFRLTDAAGGAPSGRLLDVGVGSGGHIPFLKKRYSVTGLDIEQSFVEIVHRRHPDVVVHRGDMAAFDINEHFELVVCLFSSIGYVRVPERLNAAVACMADHLKPGGVLAIEPWFSPDAFFAGRVHAAFVDQPELKIARMHVSRVEGRVSILDFNYLVATPAGIRDFRETHELGLFTNEEYSRAFANAGLSAVYDEQGLSDRGLFIAKKRA